MKYMNTARKFGRKLAIAAPLALVSAGAFAADPTTLAELAGVVTTEMAPVKTALLAIGAILVGIAALLFGIYKVVSMSKGGR
jgi:hypothetical protein